MSNRKNRNSSIHLLPQINLFDLSRYRTELMGIAALWVVLCHAKQHSLFPSVISAVLGLGNNCVDIFLFLGGMGMYFSLEKCRKHKTGILSWYKTRFIRVIIPYLIAAIPFYIWFTIYNEYPVWRFFYHLSTLSFWGEHEGMWYVDLLIPLYLITPFIANIIDNSKRRIVPTIALMSLFLAITAIPLDNAMQDTAVKAVFVNIQSVSCRIPMYVLGYYCGEAVMNKKNINFSILPISLLCFFVLYKFVPIKILYSGWLLSIFMMLFFCLIMQTLERIKFSKVLKWLGVRSLELYLANCILVPLLYSFSWKFGNIDLSHGNYFYYIVVIILNFPLAQIIYIFNRKICGYVGK